LRDYELGQFQSALAKYEDTASYQKKFKSEFKVDTVYMQPQIASRNEGSTQNKTMQIEEPVENLIGDHPQTRNVETGMSMNNELLHIKQVKKFDRRENARRASPPELALAQQQYKALCMQQLLASNSSENRKGVPDLNLIMELDQNLQGGDLPASLPRVESSSRVKS
jgi:hypothetical protein